MPMNDFTLASVHNHEKQSKILNKFYAQMAKILNRINKCEEYYAHEPLAILVEKRNRPFCKECYETDRNFNTSKKCNGCGICTKVCPVGNIELVNKSPIWKHSCQLCLACFHYCPQEAISYKDKNEGIIRYHHPDISVSERIRYK